MMEENNSSCSSNEIRYNSSYSLRGKPIEFRSHKFPVVKLYRLSDKTVQRMCGRSARRQSEGNMCSNKEKAEKRLIIEMEKILTEWVKNRARKNAGRVRRVKVMKKAKLILERLKAKSGDLYKDSKFKVTKKWFARYRARAGWFDKYHAMNPALFPHVCRKCKEKCLKTSNSSEEPDIVILSSTESSTVGGENNSVSSKEKKPKRSPEIIELMSHLDLSSSNRVVNCDFVAEEVQENNNIESVLPIPHSVLLVGTDETNNGCEEKHSVTKLNANVIVPTSLNNYDSSVDCNAHNSLNAQFTGQGTVTDTNTISSSNFVKIPSSMDNSLANLSSTIEWDSDPVWTFQKDLAKIVRQEKYTSQQIFNVQETVLFWKKKFMDSTVKEERVQGLSESKDPLTLVLGTNASGDCKFQPVVVYSVENPSSIQHIIKSSLPLLWKFHPRAKMTVSLFEDWFMYGFIPSVRVFCLENKLPFKILLLLDSSLCHRRSLEFAHPSVKVIFMPSNIASQLQPISQGISDCFKLNYLKKLVEVAAENEELYGLNLETFWDSFNILHAVKIISSAWNDVSKTNIVAAWKIISTKPSLERRHFNAFQDIKTGIIQHAVRLQLNLSQENVADWLNYHVLELTNEEQCELEKRSLENSYSEAQMPRATLSCDKLLEAFHFLDAAMNIFEMEDPNFKRSSLVRENIRKSYECYKAIYLKQKKVTYIPDCFLTSSNGMETGDANSSDETTSISEIKLPT